MDDSLHGVPSRGRSDDRVVWSDGSTRILLVHHATASLSQRRIADRVASLAWKDAEYDRWSGYHANAPDCRDPHIFLLEVDRWLVGFLLVERRDYAMSTSWTEYGRPGRQFDKAKPVWSICMIWIHDRHRRQGWASALIHTATTFLRVGVDAIGWYAPFTAPAESLVRKLCPVSFLEVG